MKKFYNLAAALILVPALAVATADQAAAQRRNTTSHDVKPVNLTVTADNHTAAVSAVDNSGCKCGQDAACMKKCNKMQKSEQFADRHHKRVEKPAGKHHRKMIEEKKYDIEEDYNKALRRIDKSSFNQEQKDLLKKQAQQNRDFALKQVNDRQQLMQQQMQARQNLDMRAMTEHKANRKALKSVSRIGIDD